MPNDLLSESVNNILDAVETSLCLPIIILIVLCTLQFVIYDLVDIGCTTYQAIQNLYLSEDPCCIINRAKGVVSDCMQYLPKKKQTIFKLQEATTRLSNREDEWDLLDENEYNF